MFFRLWTISQGEIATTNNELMARARNIKPSIFKNEVLGTADPLLTILFESLWCLADKAGRLEDRPLRIKAETFPYREGIDVDKMLTDLQQYGFIRRYVVDELRLIEVLNFSKHQRPHHTEKESELPCFSSTCHVTVKSPSKDALIPDSLNTDSLIPEKAAATAADAPDPVEKRIWKDGIDLLKNSGLIESSARPLLGRWARDHGKTALAEAIAAAQANNPADPKTYIGGVLKKRKEIYAAVHVGKYEPDHNETEPDCKTCFDTKKFFHFPTPGSIVGAQEVECPDCEATG